MVDSNDLPSALLEMGLEKPIFDRLNFLLRSSNNYVSTCAILAQRYSAQFRMLARVSLYKFVDENFFDCSLCPKCNNLLKPGLNCKMRLRSHSKKSLYNRKRAKSTKKGLKGGGLAKNRLVLSCNLCKLSTNMKGFSRSGRHSIRAAILQEKKSKMSQIMAPTVPVTPNLGHQKYGNVNKKSKSCEKPTLLEQLEHITKKSRRIERKSVGGTPRSIQPIFKTP